MNGCSGERCRVVNTSADRLGGLHPSIHSDAGSIATMAADHFQELGYTEFAYVGYAPLWVCLS